MNPHKTLANPPKTGWMIKGKLILQPYVYMDVRDWLQMICKECPQLDKWLSENQTVDKEALSNRICEVLDETGKRI